MSPENIALIIKWGPLALVSVVFLWCFLLGVIRGTYKVTVRMIYVILYVGLVWFFINDITAAALDTTLTIEGTNQSVRTYIVDALSSNETIIGFLSYSPNLYELILESPQLIVTPILFIILTVVVLPLSFPIYFTL